MAAALALRGYARAWRHTGALKRAYAVYEALALRGYTRAWKGLTNSGCCPDDSCVCL